MNRPDLPWWPTVPTMLSPEELGYVYWLARRTGGPALEIGPWLGASTLALGRGLRGSPLFVVDTFVWRPYMADRAGLGLSDGDSFRPEFDANVSELSEVTTIEAALPDDESGDPRFPKETFPCETFDPATIPPVQLAFVDGAKSWLALRSLLAGLAFRPNGLLVLQDYFDPFSYWVPMLMAAAEAETIGGRCATFRAPFDVSGLPHTIADVDTDQGLAWLAHVPLAAVVFGHLRGRELPIPSQGRARGELLSWLGRPADESDRLRPVRLAARGMRATLGLAR